MEKITPFLMFEGNAEEAIYFYRGIFNNSEINFIKRYQAHENGPEGEVGVAVFSLNGQEFKCIDTVVKNGFSFSPSLSMFVECETEKEVDDAFEKLSADGQVLVPLTTYPFSSRFGWVADKFGISWQITYNK